MKEGAKTLFLGLFLATTLVMVGLVWMKVPPETEQIISKKESEQEISEELKQRFMPKKAIVNFGPGQHTVSYRVNNFWPFYQNILKESFPKNSGFSRGWKEISNEEYYNLHQNPSVAFDLGSQVYSHLFLESFNLEDRETSIGDQIKQIYFSSNGAFLVLVTDQGNFKYNLSDVSSQGMEKFLNSLKEESTYLPYKSLFELYAIDNLTYIPIEAPKESLNKYYQNDIVHLDPAYENDLAQRFLDQPVEAVNVIKEGQITKYVYGQKTLSIDQNGLIDFINGQTETRGQESNLTDSIEVALSFVLQKTGIAKKVYFDSVKKIERDGRKGYHLELNYLENDYPVFPIGKENQSAYIKMDIIENNVEHFSYLYRTDAEQEVLNNSKKTLVKIEDAINKNIDQLGLEVGLPGKPLVEILERVENINVCLLDQVDKTSKPLVYGYELDFGHKKIYFHGLSGEMIMER